MYVLIYKSLFFLLFKFTFGTVDGRLNIPRILLSKRELRNMIGAITGYLPLRSYLKKIDKAESTDWSACAEDVETLKTWLCKCPTFSRLGRHIIQGTKSFNLEDVALLHRNSRIMLNQAIWRWWILPLTRALQRLRHPFQKSYQQTMPFRF